jgi:hypothetical protein
MANPIHKNVFNDWRNRYRDLSYAEHQDFAKWLEKNYPSQEYFDDIMGPLTNFIEMNNTKKIKVMEFGGWKGELASRVLKGSEYDISWDNYDICPTLPRKSACTDSRYKLIVLDDFVWNHPIPSYSLFVSSHAIEHIDEKHFYCLLDSIQKIPFLFINLPLLPDGATWEDATCFHILPLYKDEFIRAFLERHYWFIQHSKTPTGHFFFFMKGNA